MHPEIEIVSHCWCYTRLLGYQLSSLVLHPPEVSVQMTVFACRKDRPTVELLDWFAEQMPLNVALEPVYLRHRQIKRRAIGRNLAALATSARLVWFADCDMIFGPGCLDELSRVFPHDETLCFPKVALKTTYEDGAELVAAATEPAVRDVPWDRLVPTRQRAAIGGVQIVKGTTANRHGYLPDHKRYQTGATRWKRTYEDRQYRKYLAAGRGVGIDLPNNGRIRHRQCGRFQKGLRL